MRRRGSVLIVVLGLLAILAVVGITFVTMSTIDRSAAFSFAINTQMVLAADGAVDYVAATLVNDVWYSADNASWSLMPPAPAVAPHAYTCAGTDGVGQYFDPWLSDPIVDPTVAVTNRSFAGTSKTATAYGIPNFGTFQANWGGDTNLANGPNNLAFPTTGSSAVTIPSGGYGVWIPELSFPFEQYLVRVSLTVLDHGALLNLNAHGNAAWTPPSTSTAAPRSLGYHISDLNPVFSAGCPLGSVTDFIKGATGLPRWGVAGSGPTVPETGETLVENPKGTGVGGANTNYPFALDDEVRLRIMKPVTTMTRLDGLATGQNWDSNGSAALKGHLAYTTVGWTSDVMSDLMPGSVSGPSSGHLGYDLKAYASGKWSAPKLDINRTSPKDIYSVLYDNNGTNLGMCFSSAQAAGQFVANLAAFRSRAGLFDQGGASLPKITLGGTDYYGADRQPIFSAIQISRVTTLDSNGKYIPTFTVTVEVCYPWPGRNAYETTPINTSNMRIVYGCAAANPASGTVYVNLPPTMTPKQVWHPIDQVVTGTTDKQLFTTATMAAAPNGWSAQAMDQSIELRLVDGQGNTLLVLDRIELVSGAPDPSLSPLITAGAGGMNSYKGTAPYSLTVTMSRGIRTETEERVQGSSCYIPVLYMGPWRVDAAKAWGTIAPGTVAQTNWIPIRFPKCIDSTVGSDGTLTDNYLADLGTGAKVLPDFYATGTALAPTGTWGAGGGKSFKAFPRLGDLNQVLCSKNTGGTAYWPWTLAVAKAANTAAGEQNLKFDWQPVKKNLATDWSPGSLGSTSDLSRCANLFCVGGPWNDGIDNDGDGFTDSCNNNQAAKPDTGLKDDGSRFSGPELRVQGKINLNTATGLTLQCLESSLGMPSNTLQTGTGGPNTMKWANARPMLSPTWILAAMTGGGGSTALLAKGDSAAAGAVLTDANSKGWVEDRDWWWTLMSNMVTIRSDTFSVYGTVEVVEPSGASGSVSLRGVRMRHFWALIDRSPTLAFPPVMATPANATGPNFIHPRIMNFQWID